MKQPSGAKISPELLSGGVLFQETLHFEPLDQTSFSGPGKFHSQVSIDLSEVSIARKDGQRQDPPQE